MGLDQELVAVSVKAWTKNAGKKRLQGMSVADVWFFDETNTYLTQEHHDGGDPLIDGLHNAKVEKFHEWRNWHQLNNVMRMVHAVSGGEWQENSDNICVRLTAEDLHRLKRSAKKIEQQRVQQTIFSSGFENKQEHNVGTIDTAVNKALEFLEKTTPGEYQIWYHCG